MSSTTRSVDRRQAILGKGHRAHRRAAVRQPALCPEDIQTLGDQIVVRGKDTGTPAGEFFGVKPDRQEL